MIRAAVIGVGAFGKNHARVVAQSFRAKLEFVVDSDAGRAQAIAHEFGARAASDFRDVIGNVDAAIVAVPTTAHAAVGCALMEAGIDVLVEKPIAPTVEEAGCLVETAERSGRVL
jgi:predicted dehydrogenase